MLTQEENELLTRVGPGTPMGSLLRRYWTPALLASELPERNCDPVRVRLLGENFVAWRDGMGRVAFFDENCMHRGTSLALARSEGDGLRCIYHGWKYAADGTILDTPNYKKSTVKDKLKAPVYPAREAGELVWVYLGPPDKIPDLPNYEFMNVPAEHRGVSRSVLDCNWVQAMEGHLDSSHAAILHDDWDPFGRKVDREVVQFLRGDEGLVTEDDAPVVEVEDTTFGFHSAAIRDAMQGGRNVKYARVHAWAFPWLSIFPPRGNYFEIPIDDEHVNAVFVQWDPVNPVNREVFRALIGRPEHFTEWLPNYAQRYGGTAANRWHQDRDKMRNGSFSGINALGVEDWAVVASMGPIYDRRREHLIPADVAVIRMRRLLIRAAQRFLKGVEPLIPTADETAKIEAGDGVLEDGQTWQSLVPGHKPLPQQVRDAERVAAD